MLKHLVSLLCCLVVLTGSVVSATPTPTPTVIHYSDAGFTTENSNSYLVYSEFKDTFDAGSLLPNPTARFYQTMNGKIAIAADLPDKQLYVIDLAKRQLTLTAPLPSAPNGAVVEPVYSQNRAYSAYNSATESTTGTNWTLTLTNNLANTSAELTGHYKYGGQQNTYDGEPQAIGWAQGGTALVVILFAPASDGQSLGYDLINLAGVKFTTNPTPIAPPKAQPLVPPGIQVAVLSPDGNYIAYLDVDKSNPAVGFQSPDDPSAMYFQPFNTLHLVDLNTLQNKVVASAKPGEGLSNLAWTPDSQKLYFMSGPYNHSLRPMNAHLTNYDLTAKQVTVGPVLPSEDQVYGGSSDMIASLLPCDGTLYMELDAPMGNNQPPGVAFYSVAYNDPSTFNPVDVDPALNPRLNMCVADSEPTSLTVSTAIPTSESTRLPVSTALLTTVPTINSTTVPKAPSCLPTQLISGGIGQVTPGTPNILRATGSPDGQRIASIPGGARIQILDSQSTCVDGYLFRHVAYGGQQGWTVESSSTDRAYWITPVVALPTDTHFAASSERTDAKGIKQVYVPAGCFPMGSDPGTDPNAQPDEQPQHHVCLTNGFWLDEFDVTNAAFDAFVQAGGYNDDSLWSADGLNWKQTNNINGPETDCGQYSSRPNQPRICVNYYEAEAYAKWRGGMLPTEAEHEYAARGTDARIYPWGNNFQPGRVNTSDAPIGKPSNVDAYPAGRSWVGAYDMSGNVWNWVRDWYDANYYAVSPQNDPLGATTSQFRALRGGSWLESFIYTRAAVRHPHAPVRRGTNIGFRVVLPG